MGKSASTSVGSIQHLDTKYFSEAITAFSKGVTEYNRIKTDVQKNVSQLLRTWDGKGKKQYEYDYDILYRQLEDIGDVLYELYDALVKAEAIYIKADEKLAKQLTK